MGSQFSQLSRPLQKCVISGGQAQLCLLLCLLSSDCVCALSLHRKHCQYSRLTFDAEQTNYVAERHRSSLGVVASFG